MIINIEQSENGKFIGTINNSPNGMYDGVGSQSDTLYDLLDNLKAALIVMDNAMDKARNSSNED